MTTRIRYVKNIGVNSLASKENFLLPTGELIRILLDTDTNTYTFLTETGVVSTGTAKNLLALKKLVRSTLIELGVPLEKEVKKWTKKQSEVAA